MWPTIQVPVPSIQSLEKGSIDYIIPTTSGEPRITSITVIYAAWADKEGCRFYHKSSSRVSSYTILTFPRLKFNLLIL